nr:hypothetical protein GCM10025732_11210 [Glycomyces mayteni]
MATQARRKRSNWVAEFGWRHLVAVAVLVFGLVPILYVVSAAFNPKGTLSATGLIPTDLSLVSFDRLFSDPNIPFGSWFANSLMIAVPAAFLSILISSLAAYAFSRFRFRGGAGCCCSCCSSRCSRRSCRWWRCT